MTRNIISFLWPVVILFICCHTKSTDNQQAEDVNKSSRDTVSTMKDHSGLSYDLSKPVHKWELPDQLKEISGNTWIDNNHLLVIEDLHPNLYLVRLDNTATIEKTVPFETASDKKVDIEDVTMADNIIYALWSHGVIYAITDWRTNEKTKEFSTFLDKKNNTEGICYDPVTGNLLVACKNDAGVEDEKKSARAIYVFDRKTEKLNEEPAFLIEKKDFKSATGDKLDFYPSAIAVHPVTHDIYILSTKENKCMAQYSHDGKFKSVQFIDKDLMPQPEGICFSPDGNLFISTEGRHGQPARIYEFSK